MRYYVNTKIEVLKDSDTVCIIIDFAKHYVGGKKFNSLMISVLTFNKETQQKEWIYLDFIEKGKGGQQDYFFQ